MNDENPQSKAAAIRPDQLAQFQKQLRATVYVFVTLLVLLGCSVAISYLQLSRPAAIGIALAISTIQAVLSASVFMHLRYERPHVVRVLMLTAVFFLALMLLIYGSFANAVTPHNVP